MATKKLKIFKTIVEMQKKVTDIYGLLLTFFCFRIKISIISLLS